MTFAGWMSLAAICLLGAMSPGPSLVVVLQNTLTGGRSEGVKTSLGHGAGIGLYAFATATGLGVLVTGRPWVLQGLQWAGLFPCLARVQGSVCLQWFRCEKGW